MSPASAGGPERKAGSLEAPSRYEVLAKIATGGMATVFVGRARGAVGFSRLVAIKRPHPFVADDPLLRRSLEHEARIASMIHHPNVVSVLDVELRGDELTLVLDYVDGGTLSDLSRHASDTKVTIPTGVAVRIVLDVASGLHAAHVLCDSSGAPLGVVHRDLSPQNVLVGQDGHSRLTDFGIAKIASEIDHTATEVMKGKVGYMAPEYIEARTFDARSDQYALAVVAWEALAGRRLFRGANDVDTLRTILERGAPLLSEAAPDLAALDGVFGRALARDPSLRFESVAAFANELEDHARRHAKVATYGEVATVVEAAVGARLRQRRASIETAPASSAVHPAAEPALPSPRDIMLTQSLSQTQPPGVSDTIEPDRAAKRRTRLVGVLVIVGVGAAGTAMAVSQYSADHSNLDGPAPVATPATAEAAPASTALAVASVPVPASAPPETTAVASSVRPPSSAQASSPPRPVARPVRRRPGPQSSGVDADPTTVRAPPNPYAP
jgi:eukaryotic-like serine/threonine-protein kinase